AVITNNNVNASAMKLAQAQQEQKLVNTAVITNNNVNASAMKLTQAQQEQKMIGEHTAPSGMDLSSTVSSSKPIVQQVSSQPIKATAKDPSVSASEPGAISQEHFNTLDHAHNENVNAIASNHSAINANSTAISRNANRIEHLESQQDTDRKHANAGAANALAISGLHYTNDVNSIAIGAGNYESENAASIGYRHTFNEGHAAVTVAASEDSVGNNGLAVSGAIGW
ncbi:YadA C-terminal domain-containing protein, partial [Kluyvera intermedia]|uniref:YadA C-terminal domain-containing protein n=1 Tax=Kluyvera intermedia TaxID=61648 RepID=UPI0035265868